MARTKIGELLILLRDGVSGPAKKVEGALAGVKSASRDLEKLKHAGMSGLARDLDRARQAAISMSREMQTMNWSRNFTAELQKLRVAPAEFKRISDAWRQLQAEMSAPTFRRSAATVLSRQLEFERKNLAELINIRGQTQSMLELRNSVSNITRRGGRLVAGAAGAYGGAQGVRGGAIAGASDQRETFRQSLAGMTPEEQARLRKTAGGLSSMFPSVSNVDVAELGRGARNLTGDMAKGLALLPDIVRARVAIQSATGGAGDGELDQLMKAGDIAGLQDDPARFKAFLESFTKAVQVEGKQLSAGDFLSFYRRAKMAGSGFSDAFIAAAAPSLMQELGGPTAGTALMTFFQQMAGGRAKKETLAAQTEAGLRGPDGVLKDRQAFIADPFEWTQKHIAPLLAAKNVDRNDPAAMIDFLLPLFSDRNAAEIASKFILQADQIRRNQRMYAGAKGLAAADEARNADPYVAAAGAMNSLRNAAAALADPVMPAATAGLNSFANVMNSLASKLRDDPELAKKASAVATGAAVGAGAIGSIRALVSLATGGGVSGAIANGLRGGVKGGLIGGIGSLALTPLLALRDAGEAKRPVTPWKQRLDQEISPDAWERSKRQADEMRRDPEGARGRAMAARDYIPQIVSPIESLVIQLEAAMRGKAQNAFAWGTKSAYGSKLQTDADNQIAAIQAKLAALGPEGVAAGQQAASGVQAALSAAQPGIMAQVEAIMSGIKARFGAGVDLPVRVNGGGAGDGAPPAARASGGSVYAGQLYRINEFGEEYFSPGSDGSIVNGRQAGGGGSVTISPNVQIASSVTMAGTQIDIEDVVRQTMAKIEGEFRSALQGLAGDYGIETV